MNTLSVVLGATGQLGGAVIRQLLVALRDYTNDTLQRDEGFDNFVAMMGPKPRSLADSVNANAGGVPVPNPRICRLVTTAQR
jgi:hypothetical protein